MVKVAFFVLLIFLAVITYGPKQVLTMSHMVNDWHYEVTAGEGARELEIIATFPAGVSSELVIDPQADDFVSDVEIDEGGNWQSLELQDEGWIAPSCASQG